MIKNLKPTVRKYIDEQYRIPVHVETNTVKLTGKDYLVELEGKLLAISIMIDYKLGLDKPTSRPSAKTIETVKEELMKLISEIEALEATKQIEHDLSFIKESDIPKENREEFTKWMNGQTRPIPETEKKIMCYYPHDYFRWFDMKFKGKTTYWD